MGMSEKYKTRQGAIQQQTFCSIMLTHKRSHKEVYRDFQPSLTSFAGGAKGGSDHRFRVPPDYTAQLPTLHQHRANNQYRTANQIYPTLGVAAALRQHLNSLPSKYYPSSTLLNFSDRTRTGISKLISRCALTISFVCLGVAIFSFSISMSCLP